MERGWEICKDHAVGTICGELKTVVFVAVLIFGALLSSFWIDSSGEFNLTQLQAHQKRHRSPYKPLVCASRNDTIITCPGPGQGPITRPKPTSTPSCPEYFRWIHEDLRPWKETGITKDMVERARRTASFRLLIINGTAYVEKFRTAIQTRDVFTQWGILQLLRLYLGRLPDLELMFDCNDRPRIRPGEGPPPLFRYCGDKNTLDLVFPDWSFWGWAEINIKPWEPLLKEMKEGNERMKWKDRVPYAYWKGNPYVSPTRRDLLKCNVSDKTDWNARIFVQDWNKEAQEGYKQSNLPNQCTYRYKIYIEGWAWSVSEKYILACNSPTLYVKSKFYDFFSRGLKPLQHYWPVRTDQKCKSLKFAVDWGNSHLLEAETMGKASSSFIQEELKMDYVYDYMFHLLNGYAKLLTYKPTKPPKAVQLCVESMACPAKEVEKKFMIESMVKYPRESGPCTLPPPYDPATLQELLRRNENATKTVETRENEALKKQTKV